MNDYFDDDDEEGPDVDGYLSIKTRDRIHSYPPSIHCYHQQQQNNVSYMPSLAINNRNSPINDLLRNNIVIERINPSIDEKSKIKTFIPNTNNYDDDMKDDNHGATILGIQRYNEKKKNRNFNIKRNKKLYFCVFFDRIKNCYFVFYEKQNIQKKRN